MTIVSLFSGAGGLDYGIKSAGNDILWANDIDKNAVETYRHNIGNEIHCADISNIDIKDIPNSDVVVGGFPCQGFSQANLRRTIDDERNHLYKFFYQVIEEKQPLFFIAENVKGILSLGDGEVIKQILADFESAGYVVELHKVNMANYGIPQTRERVLIIGQNKKKIGNKMLFQFPKELYSKGGMNGLQKWISIKDVLDKYPDPDMPNNLPNHVYSKYKVVYRNFTAHRQTNPDYPSPTILARGNGKGGVCAIPHYNGKRRLTIRESAAIQTFPDNFEFFGSMGACYRQIGNAVPVKFAELLGKELVRLEKEDLYEKMKEKATA